MPVAGFKARALDQAEQTAIGTGKRHLASLDSLRGVGVILIFANHFLGRMSYILFGWIGLWIFFVHQFFRPYRVVRKASQEPSMEEPWSLSRDAFATCTIGAIFPSANTPKTRSIPSATRMITG